MNMRAKLLNKLFCYLAMYVYIYTDAYTQEVDKLCN